MKNWEVSDLNSPFAPRWKCWACYNSSRSWWWVTWEGMWGSGFQPYRTTPPWTVDDSLHRTVSCRKQAVSHIFHKPRHRRDFLPLEEKDKTAINICTSCQYTIVQMWSCHELWDVCANDYICASDIGPLGSIKNSVSALFLPSICHNMIISPLKY